MGRGHDIVFSTKVAEKWRNNVSKENDEEERVEQDE